MNKSESRVQSPCIRKCCLNDDDNCLGCFRSVVEIMRWGQARDDERRSILLNASQRRNAYNMKWKMDEPEGLVGRV